MDYYQKRKEAIKLTDSLIEKGISKEKTIFIVERETGFGEKMVKQRINLYSKVAEPLKPSEMAVKGDD